MAIGGLLAIAWIIGNLVLSLGGGQAAYEQRIYQTARTN